MARCFKITVATTNAVGNSTYGLNLNYIDCLNGVLYVITERPSDIEKLIDHKKIMKIEDIGIGYTIEQT